MKRTMNSDLSNSGMFPTGAVADAASFSLFVRFNKTWTSCQLDFRQESQAGSLRHITVFC
jgi:hypothetical protein